MENELEKSKGGIKKIKDYSPKEICLHPEHNPPGMMVFEPGEYEHTCPACGKITRFVVPLITC
jgi:hypothetical protein